MSLCFTLLTSSTALKYKMLCAHLGECFVEYALQLLSIHSLRLKALFIYLFILMNPALQGLVQRSRRLVRGNLKAVYLKSKTICICQFLHYFGLFIHLTHPLLHLTHSLPSTLDYFLKLVESHEVILIVKQHKCNKEKKQEFEVCIYIFQV